jgi:energy-coupling factor transport system substrate-specific component
VKGKRGLVLLSGVTLAMVALAFALGGSAAAGSSLAALLVAGIATLVVLAFTVRFESSHVSARELAIISLLGTLSALLRVPFAAIPGFQPSTYVVVCAGYVFGPVAGFMVGAMTAVVSNFFLGHGPWTLFQVLAWGLAGASAPLLRRAALRAGTLAMFGICWGILFGLITDAWMWVAFVYPLTLRTFAVTLLNSVSFDVMHAAGNALFLGLLGVRTIRILERYHKRFNWVRVESGEPFQRTCVDGSGDARGNGACVDRARYAG